MPGIGFLIPYYLIIELEIREHINKHIERYLSNAKRYNNLPLCRKMSDS